MKKEQIKKDIVNQKEQEIMRTIKEFANKLPKFDDGRIDYTNSDIAPVVIVFLKYKDKIILLKRSDKVNSYQGRWNTVAGYLDELKPVTEKAKEEIKEELGICDDDILSAKIGETYQFTDTEINKTWIVHPVLIELKKKPDIKLDWEHTEYKWIKPEETKNLDVVPNFEKSLKRTWTVQNQKT